MGPAMPFRQKIRTCVISQYSHRICSLWGFTIAILLLSTAFTEAADNYWNVTSGDWSDTNPSPWSLGTEPTSSDNAYIQNGGTATIYQTGEKCSYLYLGASGAGNSGTIEITGGSLSAAISYIGDSGTGTFTQTGGTSTISNSLYLGHTSGSNGTYTLSDSGQLNAGYENIGDLGSGTFIQTGGTNTISQALYVNAISSANATYTLSNSGQMSTSYYQYIGSSGTGTFNQYGGMNTISSDLYLGLISGSTGTYNLSDTGQLSAKFESIGYSGTGIFNQSGGTNTLSLYLYLGRLSGSSGTYNLSDSGQLSASIEYIGYDGPGTFIQNGGTNNVNRLQLGLVSTGTYNLSDSGVLFANDEYIGWPGNGTFTQIGGINSISSGLYLGTGSGSIGTYNLSNSGNLSASVEYIGKDSTGTFTQTGGTNSITNYFFVGQDSGSNGTYNLSGSGQLTSVYEYIGNLGTGLLLQTGGINSTNYIKIGTNGTYTLSGGTLNINGGFVKQGILDLSSSSAAIHVSSSIINLSGSIIANGTSASIDIDENSLLILPIGFDPSQYFAVYKNDGITHQVGSTLEIPTTRSIYGIGEINDHVNCQGNLSATLSYYINLNGGLTITNTGSVNLGTGNLYVNDVLSGMTDGTLNEGNLYIASIGTGTFKQNGGTNSISSELDIGCNTSGYSGTYTLIGGTLSATNMYISKSGYGRFEWFCNGLTTKSLTLGTYGTLAMGFDFDMGSLASGALFNGAPLTGLSSSTLEITNGATATQSGNTPVSIKFFQLGTNTGSGHYNLNDSGQLSSSFAEYVGYSGTGTFTQTGGTNSITSNLLLGYNSGSSGTYLLSGTGQLSAGTEYIGNSGTGTFTQTGGTNSISSSLILGNNSNSSGAYYLTGGSLILKSLSQGSGVAAFNFGGGTLQASDNFTATMPMTLTGIGGNANIDTAGHAVTLSRVISGSGGLNKLGGGTLTISASNIYSGDTKIYGGNIKLVNVNALQYSTLDYNSYGGTLSFGTLTSATLGGLKGNQDLSLINTNSAAVAMQVGYNGQSTNYSGSLSGAGSLNKKGTGTFTLSGSNSFTGSTIIAAGALVLDYTAGNTNKLSDINNLQINGSAALQLNGGAYTEVVSATALNGGTLELSRSGYSDSILRMNNITSANGTSMNLAIAGMADTDTNNSNGILAPNGRACVTVGGTDWAQSTASGAADTPITAYSAYTTGADTGWTTVSNVSVPGSTSLSANRTINTLKINTSASGQSLNIGSGRTLSINAGGLLFVGANDYSITNGTLKSMTAPSDLIIQTYGTGALSIGSIIANGNLASSLTKTGSGTLNLSSTNTFTGAVYFNGGLIKAASLNNLGNGSALNFNGGGLQFDGVYDPSSRTMAFQSGCATLDTQTHNITLSHAIGNSGDGGLIKQGSGVLTLSGVNTFTGPVNFNAGLIKAASLYNLGNGNFLNFNGGGLQFSSVFDPSVRIMTFQVGGATIDTQTYNITMANPIGNGGAGGLTKLGSGTLTLSGQETYAGDTTINGGTLAIAGSIDPNGTSLIDLQSGTAILKTVNVNKPNLNINTAPLATFEIVNGSHTVGAISGSGTTQIDAGANLAVTSIYQNTLTMGSGATLTIQPIPGGFQGSTIVPVPEPSSFVLLFAAFILAISILAKKHKS
jgi:autotransporter-associated beta strand protein